LAVLRPREGGLRRGENFWLCLTTASSQCLRLSERFFHYLLTQTAPCNFITTKYSTRCIVVVNRQRLLGPVGGFAIDSATLSDQYISLCDVAARLFSVSPNAPVLLLSGWQLPASSPPLAGKLTPSASPIFSSRNLRFERISSVCDGGSRHDDVASVTVSRFHRYAVFDVVGRHSDAGVVSTQPGGGGNHDGVGLAAVCSVQDEGWRAPAGDVRQFQSTTSRRLPATRDQRQSSTSQPKNREFLRVSRHLYFVLIGLFYVSATWIPVHIGRWLHCLQLRFDFDSTAVRLPFDGIWLQFDWNSTSIQFCSILGSAKLNKWLC